MRESSEKELDASGTVIPTNGTSNGLLREFETNQVLKVLPTVVVHPYNGIFDAISTNDLILNSGPMRYDLSTNEYVPDNEFDYVDASGTVHRAILNNDNQVQRRYLLRASIRARTQNRDSTWDPTYHDISSSDDDLL